MLAGVQQRGEPVEMFLMAAGISPSVAQYADATVSVDQYAALYRFLVEIRKDEALGLFSDRLGLGSFAVTTAYALGAGTLGQAIRRTIRVIGLLQRYFTLGLRRCDDRMSVTVTQLESAHPVHPFASEMLLLVYSRFFSWLVGGQLPVLRFSFIHARPLRPRDYQNIFMAPVQFERTEDAFEFNAKYLRSPVQRDKYALHSYLTHAHANVISPRRFDQSTVLQVRKQLQFGEPAWATLQAVACALHMSPSTLQRRLTREQTSFQKLKDGARRDIAIARLCSSKVAIDALAEEIGFTDETAFRRAFKNWTGRTPGRYRVAHMADPRDG